MKAVPATYRDVTAHLRLIVNGLKELADGRINSVSEVTLTASATSTSVTDTRVGPDSSVHFEPRPPTRLPSWLPVPCTERQRRPDVHDHA